MDALYVSREELIGDIIKYKSDRTKKKSKKSDELNIFFAFEEQ